MSRPCRSLLRLANPGSRRAFDYLLIRHFSVKPGSVTNGDDVTNLCVVYRKPEPFFWSGNWAMKCTEWSYAVICVLLAVPLFLSTGRLSARGAASGTSAVAHTAKQQCINTCRSRYHDCIRVDQLPSWQCRGVYRDCTRYHCTGLGPGWRCCTEACRLASALLIVPFAARHCGFCDSSNCWLQVAQRREEGLCHA